MNKPKRAWLYLSEEDKSRLNKIVNSVGTLNDATVLTMLAAAGLRSCEEIGYRLPLPLKFKVSESDVIESIEPTEVRISAPKAGKR